MNKNLWVIDDPLIVWSKKTEKKSGYFQALKQKQEKKGCINIKTNFIIYFLFLFFQKNEFNIKSKLNWPIAFVFILKYIIPKYVH